MADKIKILQIARASRNIGGQHTGGIAKHVEDLSSCLLKYGIQPIIWDFTAGRSFEKEGILIRSNSIFAKIFSLTYSVFKQNLFFNSQYKFLSLREKFIAGIQVYQLKRLIEKTGIEKIHVHSLNRPITEFIRQMFPDIFIVVTDHGFWQNKQLKNCPENKAWQKLQHNISCADEVILISKFARSMHNKFNFKCKKYTLIPNPIRLNQIPVLGLEKKKQILFNGYNKSITVKNFHIVVDAMNSDKFFEDYRLLAIADDESRNYMKGKDVRFDYEILGPQNWETLIEMYNTSQVLVVPSKSESFGLVYLESIAVETPVIGFNLMIDEFKEVLGDGIGEGFDSENETHQDLASKIKKILQSKISLKGLREHVEKVYDWDRKIFEFLTVYQIRHG